MEMNHQIHLASVFLTIIAKKLKIGNKILCLSM